ncbi:MAG: hypothetical protein IJT16_09530 [Lachnospiraceae bacterium]|nr:hypothetical protein [Lachnospiraceae bacterium]
MALFDIIEDVSRKQIEKTETGDSRIMGVMLGQVIKNYDEKMPGLVSVILLSREEAEDAGGGASSGGAGDNKKDASRLLWARVAFPSSGGSWGHYFIPEIGDLVLVAFEQGNIERPYVIGCIPKVKDKILTGSKDAKNKFKKIVTKNGSAIIFEDITEGEGGQNSGGGGGGQDAGAKDKITIETAGSAHHILLDNEHKVIELSDKEKKNFVRLSTDKEKGHIELTAEKKLTIKVGKNITLEMNGDTGDVTLKASKLTAQIQGETSVDSKGQVKLAGTNITAEGKSMVTLKSSGPVQVSGTPIKLG